MNTGHSYHYAVIYNFDHRYIRCLLKLNSFLRGCIITEFVFVLHNAASLKPCGLLFKPKCDFNSSGKHVLSSVLLFFHPAQVFVNNGVLLGVCYKQYVWVVMEVFKKLCGCRGGSDRKLSKRSVDAMLVRQIFFSFY